jgi:hypothetical protein
MIVGPGSGTSKGVQLDGVTTGNGCVNCQFKNSLIANFYLGLDAKAVYESNFDSVQFFGNRTGASLSGASNNNVMVNCQWQKSTIDGLLYDGSAGLAIYGGLFQAFAGNGLHITDALSGGTTQVVVDSVWFESQTATTNAIKIDAGSAYALRNCRFSGTGSGDSDMIRMTAGSGLTITGCRGFNGAKLIITAGVTNVICLDAALDVTGSEAYVVYPTYTPKSPAAQSGTFTPTLNAFLGSVGTGTITASGSYKIAGDLCTVWIQVAITGDATFGVNAGNSYFSGLPFAPTSFATAGVYISNAVNQHAPGTILQSGGNLFPTGLVAGNYTAGTVFQITFPIKV